MSKYVLDTHALIWYFEGGTKLPAKVTSIIESESVQLSISIVSFWEMTIKSSLGKLELPESTSVMMERTRKAKIQILAIEPSHLEVLHGLEYFHGDPFDRLIIAQAIAEKAIIVSRDSIFQNYPLQVEW